MTEAASPPNCALLAIRSTGTGLAEDTTMRSPPMNDLSPVARCTCRHVYKAHDGPCQTRNGRGVCRCPAFDMHADQIHIRTLALLRTHIGLMGYAPSVRELAFAAGVSSSSTMNHRLDVLESAGVITRVGPRAIYLEEE